jgi:hypothetical protein
MLLQTIHYCGCLTGFGLTSDLQVALGWGPESAYVAALAASGFYVHASDDSHNMAPMANVAAHATAHRVRSAALPPPAVSASPAAPRVESSAGKHKVAFLMSDGDNIQWMCALTQQPKPTTAAEYRAATCSFLSFFSFHAMMVGGGHMAHAHNNMHIICT